MIKPALCIEKTIHYNGLFSEKRDFIMRPRLPILSAVLLSAAALAAAEPLNYNIVNFSETASAQVARDTMYATFHIRAEGGDRAAVNRNFVAKLNRFTRRIEGGKVFKSEQFNRNAYPHYQYKPNKPPVVIGWEESAYIKVESRDFAALNRLIAESQNDAEVRNTTFGVSQERRRETINQVSKAALLRFKGRAAELGAVLGSPNYKIVSLDLKNSAEAGGFGERFNFAAAPMMVRAKGEEAGMVADTPDSGMEEIHVTVQGTIQF